MTTPAAPTPTIPSGPTFRSPETPQDELVTVVPSKEPALTASVSAPTSWFEKHKKFCQVLAYAKMTLSMILILFSVLMVSAAIFTKQTDATAEYNVHPIVALVIFWVSMAWLAILEGGLNCMVGLQPVPKKLYQASHPKTYQCTSRAHSGQNIERFIVGRQYLDLTIVFSTSFMVNAISGAQVLGLPPIVNDIFLGSDLGVILCTIVFGQLVSVINSAHNMLDYINNWCMVFSTYLALLVESTGVLHAVYLVHIIFTKLAKRTANQANDAVTTTNSRKKFLKRKQSDVMEKDSESTLQIGDGSSTNGSSKSNDESSNGSIIVEEEAATATPSKPMWQRILFWARVAFSMAISVFAVIVFMTALVDGNTTIRRAIPVWISIVLLIFLLLLGGFMEALQIALFAVKHLDRAKIDANPTARRNCDLIFSQGQNTKLQSFMIGRQIAQTVIMFMVARIISVNMKTEGETMFGVPPVVQKILFDSGILNALVCTIFASLSWRVTANFFPMLYMGSPLSIWIIRLCLVVEGTGICDAAWLFAKIVSWIVGYKSDEEYIAKATQRAADQELGDLESGTKSGEGTSPRKKSFQHQQTESMDSLSSSSSSSSISSSCEGTNQTKSN